MNCLHFIWHFGSDGIILGLNPRVELQFRLCSGVEWMLLTTFSFSVYLKLYNSNLMNWLHFWDVIGKRLMIYICFNLALLNQKWEVKACLIISLLDIQEFYEVTLLNSQKSREQKLEEVKHMAEQCENSSTSLGFSYAHPQPVCVQPEVRKTHKRTYQYTYINL